MPRPPLGAAAKTKVVAIRLTAAQASALEAEFGSAPKALAALVAAHLGKK